MMPNTSKSGEVEQRDKKIKWSDWKEDLDREQERKEREFKRILEKLADDPADLRTHIKNTKNTGRN